MEYRLICVNCCQEVKVTWDRSGLAMVEPCSCWLEEPPEPVLDCEGCAPLDEANAEIERLQYGHKDLHVVVKGGA